MAFFRFLGSIDGEMRLDVTNSHVLQLRAIKRQLRRLLGLASPQSDDQDAAPEESVSEDAAQFV